MNKDEKVPFKTRCQIAFFCFFNFFVSSYKKYAADRKRFFWRRVIVFILFSIFFYIFYSHIEVVLYDLMPSYKHRHNFRKHKTAAFWLGVYIAYTLWFVIATFFISLYLHTRRALVLTCNMIFYYILDMYSYWFEAELIYWVETTWIPFIIFNFSWFVASVFIDFGVESEDSFDDGNYHFLYTEEYVAFLEEQMINGDWLNYDILDPDSWHIETKSLQPKEYDPDFDLIQKTKDIWTKAAKKTEDVVDGIDDPTGEDYADKLMEKIVKHYDHFYPSIGCFSVDEGDKKKILTAEEREDQLMKFYLFQLYQDLDRDPYRRYFGEVRPLHIDLMQYYYFWGPKIWWVKDKIMLYYRLVESFFRLNTLTRPKVRGEYTMFNPYYKHLNTTEFSKYPGRHFIIRYTDWYGRRLITYLWKRISMFINPMYIYNQLKWDYFTGKNRKILKNLKKIRTGGPINDKFFIKQTKKTT